MNILIRDTNRPKLTSIRKSMLHTAVNTAYQRLRSHGGRIEAKQKDKRTSKAATKMP